MKVSVFGQRNIIDTDVVINNFVTVLNKYPHGNLTYVFGGAKGPQEIVFNYLKGFSEDSDEEFTVDTVLFKPWTMISKKLANQAQETGKFDPVYFFFRNLQILENSDIVIIYDNGDQDAEVYKVLNFCEKKNKTYEVIKV